MLYYCTDRIDEFTYTCQHQPIEIPFASRLSTDVPSLAKALRETSAALLLGKKEKQDV